MRDISQFQANHDFPDDKRPNLDIAKLGRLASYPTTQSQIIQEGTLVLVCLSAFFMVPLKNRGV